MQEADLTLGSIWEMSVHDSTWFVTAEDKRKAILWGIGPTKIRLLYYLAETQSWMDYFKSWFLSSHWNKISEPSLVDVKGFLIEGVIYVPIRGNRPSMIETYETTDLGVYMCSS